MRTPRRLSAAGCDSGWFRWFAAGAVRLCIFFLRDLLQGASLCFGPGFAWAGEACSCRRSPPLIAVRGHPRGRPQRLLQRAARRPAGALLVEPVELCKKQEKVDDFADEVVNR